MISKEELKNFAVMMGSKSVSEIGNIAFDYACNRFLVSISSGSFYLVGIYQMSDKIIAVLLTIIGGTFADRVSRKKILYLADFISSAICIVLAFTCHHDSVIVGVVVANILLAVLSAFSGPAYKSIIKECVRKDNIKRLNSAVSTIGMVTNIIAPIISVFVYQCFALFGTLLFNGASFLLSGLMLLLLSSLEAKEMPGISEGKNSFLADMKIGAKYLWRSRRLSLTIVFSAIVNFFIAGYNLLLPYSNGMFSMSGVDAYAIFLVSEAVGGLIGALICPIIKIKNSARNLFIQMAFSGASLAVMPFIWSVFQNTVFVAAGPLLFSMFLSMFNVNFFSYVHDKVEVGYLGRVFGVVFTISLVFMPLGTATFSALLDPSVSLNYLFIGLSVLVFSVLFAFFNTNKHLFGMSNE